MKKLTRDEIFLEGKWLRTASQVFGDQVCERILWLISSELNYIKSDSTGWRKLYQDPADKRYWEFTFLHSEMQGGGPPSLTHLSENEAKQKYDLSEVK